jgi:hypothetical protein
METEEKNEPQRLSWKDRLRQRQPDIDVDDELAVGDYLGDSFTKYDDMQRQQQQFNDMLSSDPNTAGLLTGLASGVDENGEKFSLSAYLLDKYGDIMREASTTEEAIELARKKEADEVKKAAEAAKRAKEIDGNLQESDALLTEAVRKANMDEATVQGMLQWIYGKSSENGAVDPESLISKIVTYRLTADDWTRLLFAFNRDKDLEGAREEGRRSGVKARPGAAHRRLGQEGATDLGGGGGAEKPEETKDPTLRHYESMGRRF